jgi:energy-coupling factor transporter transmembrane protein EcfT
MAMEVRGYNHLVLFENPAWRGRDFASIAIAFAFVGTAVLLRAGWLS